ncbi:MAG: hypothetical protein CM15mP96_3260 [Gammaproteobacteria bacterium]|nr:MAG: hypothetical protein CM15mP96_3260 [Gammaproteobacteria bacterium]
MVGQYMKELNYFTARLDSSVLIIEMFDSEFNILIFGTTPLL